MFYSWMVTSRNSLVRLLSLHARCILFHDYYLVYLTAVGGSANVPYYTASSSKCLPLVPYGLLVKMPSLY